MLGIKKILETVVVPSIGNLYAQSDNLRGDIQEVRQWVELLAEDRKLSPESVGERFTDKLKGHTGKMSSSELRRMVEEAVQEVQDDS